MRLNLNPRHRGLHGRAHVNQQRERARYLLIFGGVRIVAWTAMMVSVGLGLVGVRAFHWAAHVSTLLPFVTMISLYANWATDLDAWTAAFAAFVAADAHQDAEHIREQGMRNESA